MSKFIEAVVKGAVRLSIMLAAGLMLVAYADAPLWGGILGGWVVQSILKGE